MLFGGIRTKFKSAAERKAAEGENRAETDAETDAEADAEA